MRKRLDRLGGSFLAAYANILSKTCRVRIEGWNAAENLLGGGSPVIFAAWHGQTHLLFPALKTHLDFTRLAMVVVDDHREAVLSTFAHIIGAQTYPISRSDTTLAGARRMLGLIRALEAKRYSYIAPDGPDGPSGVAKDGVAFLARQLGAWLIPLGAYSRTSFHLRRWDRYSLPLPYSQIRTVIGNPIKASQEINRKQLLKELTLRMDSALAAAEHA